MSVVYDVPRFSEKSTSQKGPTCWYYATKMLLKFHELFDRGTKDADNPLEALHTLRKLLTPTTGDVRDIYSASQRRMRHPLDARVRELEKNLKELKALPPADKITNHLREKGVEAIESNIAMVKAMIPPESNPKMKAVIRLIEKRIETEGSRYDFLSFALPHIKFRAVQKPDDAGMLEVSLRAFGPLYASGTLSILKTTQDNSGQSGSNEAVVAVKELGSRHGAGHAVVIAGITDQEEVFFKDPNHADELKCIAFRHMVKHLKHRLIAIDCTNRGKADEPCVHCTQKLITQTVVPPLSATR